MMVRWFGVAFALGILLAPLAGQAQQTGKPHRIGFLGNSTAALEADLVGPFREGLRDPGYVESRNVLIEYRWAKGNYERFPALVAELIARQVELIVQADRLLLHHRARLMDFAAKALGMTNPQSVLLRATEIIH